MPGPPLAVKITDRAPRYQLQPLVEPQPSQT
jgi:hypothetical protein